MGSCAHSRLFLTDLQVHSPVDPEHKYGQYQGKETEVARMIVEAHLDAGVEVIAVTDHVELGWYPKIAAAADSIAAADPVRRLWVFPGFEVNASNCHLILIWDRTDEGHETASRHLAGLYRANVQIRDGNVFRPVDDVPINVARNAVEAGALVIAPHSTAKGMGAFAKKVVTNVGDLVSSGYVSAWDVHGQKTNGILTGPQRYFGDRTPAWICTGDTRSIAEAGKRAVWLKMDQPPTLNGLRHAFLAPETRIRFPTRLRGSYGDVRGVRYRDTVEPSCSRITRVTVEGGFHDGLDVEFAPGLNAIIGGRGTGKSAIVEIIRYGLGLPDPEVDRLVENRQQNLPADAEVTIELLAADGTWYSVHRSGGEIEPPTVIRPDGTKVEIQPSARFRPAVYGQTQLRGLVETQNLRDFCAEQNLDQWAELSRSERDHIRTLGQLSDQMHQVEDQTSRKEEKEAELHDLEDRLSNAQQAGAEDKITELKTVATIGQQVETAAAWPQKVADAVIALRAVLPPPAVPDHDNVPAELAATVTSLETAVTSATASLAEAAANANAAAETAATTWSAWSRATTSAISSELAALGIEKPEQLAADQRRAARLTQEVADLANARETLEGLRTERTTALEELRGVRRKRARFLREIGESLNQQLGGAVRVVVKPMSVLTAFEAVLRKHTTGIHGGTIFRAAAGAGHPQKLADALRQARRSPTDHATDAIAGNQTLAGFGLSDIAISQLVRVEESAVREIELTDVPDQVRLEMNLGSDTDPLWQDVERMSPGQAATALLALALIGGTEPLIVDQPEEDLDNRFVFKEVVGKVAETCEDRQVIVVTHDANIPVVGDAELVLALDAEARKGSVLACGGLESPDVARNARDILEGGEDAFNERMRRYPTTT